MNELNHVDARRLLTTTRMGPEARAALEALLNRNRSLATENTKLHVRCVQLEKKLEALQKLEKVWEALQELLK